MSQSTDSEQAWFETWFDTEYYHLLYNNRDHEEAERFVLRLLRELNVPVGSQILDLGCGKGRHSKVMHGQGHRVTGLDLSENSIDSLNQDVTDGLQFMQGDMRETHFHDTFDYVFNLFTSFGYFEEVSDNVKVLEACFHGLKKQGILLIDYLNASKIKNTPHPIEAVHERGDIVFETKKELQDTHVVKNIKVIDKGQVSSFQEQVQLIESAEFRTMLESTGFEWMKAYGNYDLEAYHPETSPRLIIVARKK